MNFLKTQINLLNFFLVMGLSIAFLLWKRRNRIALRLTIVTAVLFVLCSTKFMPHLLASNIESQYKPMDSVALSSLHESVYLIVLGSGYSSSTSLPCTALLGTAGLARLTEAVRIYRMLGSAFIVSSGGTVSAVTTQAQTVRCAAIELGIPSDRIIALDKPANTFEEAEELKKALGNKIKLVVVTDALHMPRAMKIFKSFGFDAIAAPTNFLSRSPRFGLEAWFPSISNLQVMDRIVHEYFGNVKLTLTLQLS